MLDILPTQRAADEPSAAGVRNPRAILQPRLLLDALMAQVPMRAGSEPAVRAHLLATARTALDVARAEIKRRFLEDLTGGDACVREQAWAVDQLIQALAQVALDRVFPSPNPTLGEQFAIVATGGYGRAELAPASDLDLLFVLPYKRTARVEQVVEFMLYLLWDLGLKVGHAVRSVDETSRAARADVTIRTALLETRLLWGNRRLYSDLKHKLTRDIGSGGAEFVAAKLEERDTRHRRLGDSRYVLEPNIKEGKGGLRDLQTLFWIGKYLYRAEDVAGLVEAGVLTAEEATRFAKARSFLTTLRCHLHYLTSRAEERLTFDLQHEIARRMGYGSRARGSGAERFMKHYFLVAKDVGDLTRIFCAALEAETRRRPRRGLALFASAPRPLEDFALDGDRLTVGSQRQFRDRPLDLIRLFHVAQRHKLDIHPDALRLITRSRRLIDDALRADAQANRLFLEILAGGHDPEQALRRMSEAGVLGRFVPEFGRVIAQMQYDMYHAYTVDEHTLQALGILHRILTGQLAQTLPLATAAGTKIASRRALFVALLLHDVAKGLGGDHSVLGAGIAARLGPRFGLTPEETETAVWLVRWHLLMSNTALRRDLEDDKAVQDFVAAIESPERLRLLTTLTTADINAVGPGRWNAWKASLLSELYSRAEDIMSGGLASEGRDRRVAQAQGALRQALSDWSPAEIDAFIAKGYPPYWLAFDAETHARHARLLREAERLATPLVVDTRIDHASGTTEVTVVTSDHPGLFARLAGAIGVAGGTIVDARIFTLANGMALDVFSVADPVEGGPFQQADKLARLSVTIERSLSGKLNTAAELSRRRPAFPSRTRAIRIEPRVLIDNQASRTHTVIEINGRDRPGLLHDVTLALTRLGLQISSAKISTFGDRVVDVFYVKDVFGLKVSHDQKLAQTREKLLAALADPDPQPAVPVTPVRPPRRRSTSAAA